MRLNRFVTLTIAMFAAACAGGGSRGTYHGGPPGASVTSDSGESESAGEASVDHQAAPRERPGLGTVWGETVRSHVHSVSFTRASRSPFASVAIHYNDEEGVRAQTRYLGAYELAPFRTYTPGGGIQVALVDGYGQMLPGGEVAGRNLVVGRHGDRYDIVVVNRTPGRYEVVASVDGLDVLDGKPADVTKRGYILEPDATLIIDGFRRSDAAVAAFRFGRVADSYAARTSGDRNVGVIGVALFAEHGSRWSSDELYRRDTANPFPGDRRYAAPPAYP